MKVNSKFVMLFIIFLCVGLGLASCNLGASNATPVDEAKAAGKTVDDFPMDPHDNYAGMDGGIKLTEDEIKGRNSWIGWTGGNQAFWDYIAQHGAGLVDLLKLLDNRHIQRSERLAKTGLINEPGFTAPTKPDQYGLWLDVRTDPNPQYLPDPDVYGYSSGIVGLRLFPNPNFDEATARRWDAEKFITDEEYYKDPNLVRPYRVGMACAFCHVSFHPLHPPEDPLDPAWENLSSNMGSQYFKPGGIFGYDMDEKDLLWQLFNVSRPGTVDTSLVATDGNDNPNTMNGIFGLLARVGVSTHYEEELSEDSCALKDLPPEVLGGLQLPDCPKRLVPHILANGEDSIGARAALDRVYINIGEYYEEWLTNHNVMVGIKPQSPFSIAHAQENSIYWQATDQRSLNLARFLITATTPIHLEDATWTDSEGQAHRGSELINTDSLARGKAVFAEKCFACHSSKQPEDFWNEPANYEKWSTDQTYLAWAQDEVAKPDFRANNYFSTDARYPATLLQTNAKRALADNATAGRVWASFSSATFKNQPSVGEITIQHPYKNESLTFPMPAGGPGRYRPLTLISIWATAPFLHNNTVGNYPSGHDPRKHDEIPDVSVPGRLAVFNDSIEKLLWPEKREQVNSIYRTTTTSYAELPYVVLADIVQSQTGIHIGWFLWGIPVLLGVIGMLLSWLASRIYGRRSVKVVARRFLFVVGTLLLILGILVIPLISVPIYSNGIRPYGAIVRAPMIPKGTPIDLVFNGLNSPPYASQPADKARIMRAVLWDLLKVTNRKLPSLDHPDVPNLVPNLLKINKAPDFVLDRGHTFGSELSEEDKRALIEFLKTL